MTRSTSPLLLAASLVMCGCATFQQNGSGAGYRGLPPTRGGTTLTPGGSPQFSTGPAPNSVSPAPGSTPGAGDGLRSPGPILNGPSLGLPEALSDEPLPRSGRLQAPSPTRRETAYRPNSLAISVGDRSRILGDPTWSRYYRSTDRRPIESLRLGEGTRRIVIVGSLHGDEPQSVALVEELGRYLLAHREQVRDCSVLLIKTANPDGLFARSPYNVRAVDLNRNFPGSNWRFLPGNRAGDKGASEVETRALMRLMLDFEPDVVVHLKDGRGQALVNVEGSAQPLASAVGGLLQSKIVADLGQQTSGSLENYVASKLQRPALTLLLPQEASDTAAWQRNRDALLALLQPAVPMPTARAPDHRPSEEAGAGGTGASAGSGRNNALITEPEGFTSDEEISRPATPARRPRTGARSAEPPPANEMSGRFPLPVPSRGYLELPPPPGS